MTIDTEKMTFHFERVLDASPDEAFDAWTRPEQLKTWWDPTGTPLVSCTIDLRVGGTFTLKNSGHAPPFSGTYKTLERPTKLEFEANGSLGTVNFKAERAKTRMTVLIRSPTRAHFEMFTKLAIYEGTQQTFDNLVKRFQMRITKSASPDIHRP